MSNTASRFYSVMVVGDNPTELMEKYKNDLKVEKYLKYRYLDAEKLQKNSIKILSQLIDNYQSLDLTKFQIDALNEKLKSIRNMSAFEYYQTITYGMDYDDEGNAWTDVNPNGKYNVYQKGNHFSLPLINNKGEEVTSELNKNINWKLLHMANSNLYELVWELVKEGKEPSNDEEKQIYNNMINREAYFENFKDKDDYVIRNSAYWNYAYLDENGWKDIDDSKMKDADWIKNFYKNFITKLNPDDRVTIFEFTRNLDDID